MNRRSVLAKSISPMADGWRDQCSAFTTSGGDPLRSCFFDERQLQADREPG
jgi:hypothetical protein